MRIAVGVLEASQTIHRREDVVIITPRGAAPQVPSSAMIAMGPLCPSPLPNPWTLATLAHDPCAQDLFLSVGGFALLALEFPILVWLQRRRSARFNTDGCVLAQRGRGRRRGHDAALTPISPDRVERVE